MKFFYVYGIVQKGSFFIENLEGLHQELINTVPLGNFDALVSRWYKDPVTPVLPSRANLVAHQEVSTEVLKQTSLIPFSFGSILSLGELEAYCRNSKNAFHENFEKIEGKIEISLKGLWKDMSSVYQDILDENPEIQRAKAYLSNHPDQTSQNQLIEIGKMVEDALLSKKRRLSHEIIQYLTPYSAGICKSANQTESMFLNVAVLLDKAKEELFEDKIREMAEQYAQVADFKYLSPFAPYNFIDLKI